MTVNAALEALVKLRKRESFAAWLKSGGLPDLTGAAAEPERIATVTGQPSGWVAPPGTADIPH